MNEQIAIPVWFFILLVGLAGWAALVMLFMPGMRWFFRRRIKNVIHQIGDLLKIELP